MTATKLHTHCQATLAARIQSQSKSVLSFVQAEKSYQRKMPHRTTD